MKRIITLAAFFIMLTTVSAREYKVHGPQGGLAMDITLPKGFDPETEKCPMVILMHGIFSSGNIVPIPSLARELAEVGIASMTAGILCGRGEKPAGVVLIAPGSVVQDACRNGKFFSAEFNPADPPEYVKCFGSMKLGREYILSTQELDIYGIAREYTGPVRLIHGSNDSIVPLSCSEKYVEVYGDRSELIIVEDGNHMITRKKKEIVALAVEFFNGLWKDPTCCSPLPSQQCCGSGQPR